MADEVQIDALSIAIEHSANDAAKNLDDLAKGLTALKRSVSRLNLSAAASSLRELGSASSLITKYSADNLSAMAIALTGISAAPKISSTVGKNIGSIAEAANALDADSLANIERLGTVLKPLSELGRAQLTSFVNQLGKLPQVARELDSVDMDKFAASIEKTAAAIKPLADEMEKVSRGFSAFPTKIQAIIRNNEKLAASNKTAKSEFKKLFDEIVNGSKKSSSSLGKLLNTATALVLIRKGTKFIADAVDSANTYIEDLNLFNVAMGEYTQQAYDYAELVSEKMGIDPAQWMRMQAVLMDMSKSFGVASGTAYTMSKALTQLTYDISSLYNLNIDEAANKIRSALSGEIEPVRNLGKDLSVANLQLIATELGINKNVAAMTQAEKSMLRTIALLKQSDSAMGDLSRTLDQPANQLRILNAQLTLLKRSLGEMFLPLLQTVLPYAIAAVKVLRLISVQLASLAGFTLPTFDLSDSTGSMTDYTDSVEDAVEATQKLYQLSFDQLNILGAQGGVASGASSADLARLEEELNRLAAIEDYKFMENVESASDAIVESMTEWLTKGQGIEAWVGNIWNGFQNLKEMAVEIADALGLWKIPDAVMQLLKNLGLDVGSINIGFGNSTLGSISGEKHLKEDVIGGALGKALLAGAALKLLTGSGLGNMLTFGMGLGLSALSINMLYDDAQAICDESESNGLYQSVKKALELGLMGASLSLLSGKGLKFAVGLSLLIGSVSLGYEGIKGLFDDSESNDLLSTIKMGISSALMGAELGMLSGKGLSFTISLMLGFTSVSLLFAGIKALFDSSETNDLLGATTLAISTALGGVALSRMAGVPLSRSFPLILGISSLTYSFASAKSVANSDSPTGALIGVTQQFLTNVLGGMGLALTFGGTVASKLAWTLPITLALDISFTLDKIGAFEGFKDQLSESFGNLKEKFNETLSSPIDTSGTWVENALNAVNKVGELAADAINNAIEDTKNIGDSIISNITGKSIYPALDVAKNDVKEATKEIGTNINEGISQGIDLTANKPTYAAQKMGKDLLIQFSEDLGIHSPSTVFEGYGINTTEGYVNGIEEGTPDVLSAFDSLWGGIQTNFGIFSTSMLLRAESFVERLGNILSGLSFGGSMNINQSIGVTKTDFIPAYASGGLPEDGLFFANSSELLGQFSNGRTAVANNAQIVEGIQRGVYSAVLRAMQETRGGQQASVIVLDDQVVGKTFGAAIDRERRRSGAAKIEMGGAY